MLDYPKGVIYANHVVGGKALVSELPSAIWRMDFSLIGVFSDGEPPPPPPKRSWMNFVGTYEKD